MNWVLHYRVINKNDSEAFAELHAHGFGVRVGEAVEPPDVPAHVAREMQFDFAAGRTAVNAGEKCAEIGVGKDAAAVVPESVSRVGETRLRICDDGRDAWPDFDGHCIPMHHGNRRAGRGNKSWSVRTGLRKRFDAENFWARDAEGMMHHTHTVIPCSAVHRVH